MVYQRFKEKEAVPLKHKIVELKRVTRTTKRGRRFRLVALVLVKLSKSEKQNSVAISTGRAKGRDARTAIQKAVKKAEQRLTVYFPESPLTIPCEARVKFKSTKILFKPAPVGTGVKAGSVLNTFFKFLEIRDVSAKIITGSKNKQNIINCAFLALEKLTGKKNNY